MRFPISVFLLATCCVACGSDDAFDYWGIGGKGEMRWAPGDRKSFSQYVVDAQAKIDRSAVQDLVPGRELEELDERGNKKFEPNYGVTTIITYLGMTLMQPYHNDSSQLTCHCVGTTFEVMMRAFEVWNNDTRGDGKLNGLSLDDVRGNVKASWFAHRDLSKELRGSPVAIDKYGLGKMVDLEDVEPGDFASFSRNNGWSHSVIVEELIKDKQNGNIVGLKYFSCNRDGGPGSNIGMFGDGNWDIVRSSFKAARMELDGVVPVPSNPQQPQPPPSNQNNSQPPAVSGDVTAPYVSIKAPIEGSTFTARPVLVRVAALDDTGVVARIEVFVDGNQLYDARLDQDNVDFHLEIPNGSHVIHAVAYDASGNHSQTDEVHITVDAPLPPSPTPDSSTDWVKPIVQITSPKPGPQSDRKVKVEVSATDNTGISKVELTLNGSLVAISQKPPHVFENVYLPNGRTSLLVATAYDLATNRAEAQVSVSPPLPGTTNPSSNDPNTTTSSDPGKDTDPPKVSILSPGNNDKLTAGTVVVKVEATDDEKVHRVDLIVNGDYQDSRQDPPYEFSVTLPEGRSTIEATAVDEVGYRASAAIEVQVGETTVANQKPAGTTQKPPPVTEKPPAESQTEKPALQLPTTDDGCAIGGSPSARLPAAPLLLLLLVVARRRSGVLRCRNPGAK